MSKPNETFYFIFREKSIDKSRNYPTSNSIPNKYIAGVPWMPFGRMVGKAPLQRPGGLLPHQPAIGTGMIRAVLPNDPAVLVEPANLRIAGAPRFPSPLVVNGILPLAKAVTGLPVHGLLPGQYS